MNLRIKKHKKVIDGKAQDVLMFNVSHKDLDDALLYLSQMFPGYSFTMASVSLEGGELRHDIFQLKEGEINA